MTAWLALAGAAIALFLTFCLLATAGVSAPERTVYAVIADATRGAAPVFHWINLLGSKYLLFPLTVGLALPPSRRRALWWLPLAALAAVAGLEDAGKALIGRPRPESADSGFPSGHASAAAAVYFSLAHLLARRRPALRAAIWPAALLAVALVMLGRMAVQAHWPLDVLGGACLGLAAAALANAWRERRAVALPPPEAAC